MKWRLLFDLCDQYPLVRLRVEGREAWTLCRLLDAGERGITSFENPAPRLSHYIYKLRGLGLRIETREETHGGDFGGKHGRYRLRSRITIVERSDSDTQEAA